MMTRYSESDMDPQTILRLIGRGRDAAVSLSSLAETLGWSRRRVEKAAQALADDGHHPIVASTGGEHRGVYLAQTADEVDQYAEQLRGRLRSQYVRVRALRGLARRMRGVRQMEMFG